MAQFASVSTAIGVLSNSFVYMRTMSDWMSVNALALCGLIALWICMCVLIPLTCLHTWFAATNTTMFETVTGAQRLWYLAGTEPKDCDLPYSRGLCGNLRMFFCMLDDLGARWCTSRGRRGGWMAQQWAFPGVIARDSEDVWHNIWENRYWRCC